jgi:hypothetical protein
MQKFVVAIVGLLPAAAIAQSGVAQDPAVQASLSTYMDCLLPKVEEGKAKKLTNEEFRKLIFEACPSEASAYGGVLLKYLQSKDPKPDNEKIAAAGVQFGRLGAYYKFTGPPYGAKRRNGDRTTTPTDNK